MLLSKTHLRALILGLCCLAGPVLLAESQDAPAARDGSDPATSAPLTAGVSGESRSRAGSLRGSVVVGSEIEHRRVHFPIYPDLSRQAPARPVPSLADEIHNVVVYVEAAPWRASEGRSGSRPLVMRQANEAFEPHILPVLVGSKVEFPNSDPFFHNVFSLSTASAFDLGHYPAGDTRSVLFDRPGIVKVFCHLHSDMSGVILVLDNPYFTIPGENGQYRIDGIPAGEYRVVAWHERARRVSRDVRIGPGAETTLDFQIPIRDQTDSE